MVSPAIQIYFSKMMGQRYDPKKLEASLKPATRIQVLVSSFVGSFVGIAIVAALTYNAQWFIDRNTPVIAGSFGALAVLIYGAIEAPLSQPRNVIGGHLLSSFIGVSLYKLFNLMSEDLFNKLHWLLCALVVSLSLFVMQLTHTVHPPASASALIAASGGQAIYDLGYWYLLSPIALGVGLMMIVAMIVNNIVRTYPSHWWAFKSRVVLVVDQDMATTLADFVSPDDDEEEEDQVQRTVQGDVASPLSNNNKPLTHQPTISSSLSLTFSIDKETATPDNHPSDHPPTSIPPSSPRPVLSTHSRSHSHSHPAVQHAVYYGGDRNEELKDGEKLWERHVHHSGSSSPFSSPSVKDLEHGHGPTNKHHSILIGLRGSPHPSYASSPSAPKSHVAVASNTEEEYRTTIEQLRQRIQDLETRLAAASNPTST
ncbi:hypothetical protein BGZ47_004280 [Haplosporangium gracile]|nr:hypothetical protein BGZ47_004280 [Haplosporangium gracile]